jgi:hypothetical protein
MVLFCFFVRQFLAAKAVRGLFFYFWILCGVMLFRSEAGFFKCADIYICPFLPTSFIKSLSVVILFFCLSFFI